MVRRAEVALVLVVVVAGLAVVPATSAAASGLGSPKGVVATGSVTCTHVTGSITFTPAVRHIGTTPETQVITVHASGCSTKGSNVKRVASGTLVVTLQRPSNSCVGLLFTQLPKGTGTWKPSSIHRTTASFSGFGFVYATSGDVGITVPNKGGSSTVTGSFAGRDRGRRSTATIYTNMTPDQFRNACLSPAGLSRQLIVSGVATFS